MLFRTLINIAHCNIAWVAWQISRGISPGNAFNRTHGATSGDIFKRKKIPLSAEVLVHLYGHAFAPFSLSATNQYLPANCWANKRDLYVYANLFTPNPWKYIHLLLIVNLNHLLTSSGFLDKKSKEGPYIITFYSVCCSGHSWTLP